MRKWNFNFLPGALCALCFLSGSVTHAAFWDDGEAAVTRDSGGSSSGKIDGASLVAVHNKWRAEVGVPGLSYSKTLAVSAQAWADQLKDSYGCNMKHSTGAVGENIFWQSAVIWSDGRRELRHVAPKEVVDSWGSEKRNYSHAVNACKPSEVCGHYTQVVWKNTTSVGCGMAVCGNQDQIWVCQYSPAGNWAGQKPY
jgi:pathogenesis-related protein 1